MGRGSDLTQGEYFTLKASAAMSTVVANATGTVYTLSGERTVIMLFFKVTNKATDNIDTLDVYVDISPDSGTTWINAVHFAQQLGNGTDAESAVVTLEPTAGLTAPTIVTADCAVNTVRQGILGDQIRARWTLVDADANATFTWSLVGYAI